MTKRKTETVNDLSRCLDPLDMDATLIAVIEMSQSSWLVAGIVPGVERQPSKMIAVPTLAEEDAMRPSRECETLVCEASRIITRLKAAFVRLGIRSFNPKLKAATDHL